MSDNTSTTIYNVIKIFNSNSPHTFGVFPMNGPCIMEFDSELEARAYAMGCEARALQDRDEPNF